MKNRATMLPIQKFLHPLSSISLVLAVALCVAAGSQALAQTPDQASAQALAETYGPFNVTSLADGLGLSHRLNPSDSFLNGTSPWTLVFWFQNTDSHPGSTLLAGIGDPKAEHSRYIALAGGHLALALGGGSETLAPSEFSTQGWHLATAVSDGHTLTLYADGAVVTTTDAAPGKLAPLLEIAPQPPAGPQFHHFGGQIAALKIYPFALTAEQITHVFATAPDFALLTFEDSTPRWQVQTRAQAGYSSPQDPSSLPRSKTPPQKPVAKPTPGGKTELAGSNPWQIRGGWKLQALPAVKASGETLSRPGYSAADWYAATVPGTVLTTLIDRGVYPDSDYGLNNLAIPENLARQDYWYRTEFPTPPQASGKKLTLTFEGVNYAAEVWLNGHRLGEFTGAFLRGKFDITSLLAASGQNILAVRVSPPPHPGIPHEQSVKAGSGENGGIQLLDGPTFSATEGWDWIPGIRDRNTGIWQDVTLTASGAVEVGDLQVITTLPKADNSEADLEIEAPLTNTGSSTIEGELTASFDDVKVTRHLTLKPGETIARLQPGEYAALKVQHPRLWWPNGYGDPTLHKLTVSFAAAGKVSAQKQIDFGMREVSYELSVLDKTGHLQRDEVLPARTADQALPLIDESHDGIRQIDDKTPNIQLASETKPLPEWLSHTWVHSLMPEAEGSASIRTVPGGWPGTDLVIKVNGVRIAARGGDWGMDDSRKRVSIEHLEPFFRLHRDAHLNIIRNWMGQNTEESFYALADKYGLMVWNDFWESTENYNLEAQDPALFLLNARDTISRFRSHPSIVVWCGRNEGVPQPIINEGLANLVRTLDHTRYYTGSSNRVNLRDSGPYQHQTPETYYRINRGFSVELGIPSVPTIENIRSWNPAADQWPIGDTWAYHDWHQSGNGDVKPFHQHMTTQFGAPADLEDFTRKADMLDYVGHRAIFEGFAAHLWEPNSGRMLWMTQPAWPSTQWTILSSDYDTQASFYGVEKACEPIHAQLNLITNAVDLVNLGPAQPMHVAAHIESLDGKVLQDQTLDIAATANARTAVTNLDLAKLAAGHTILVALKVSDAAGKPVSSNLYWWSTDEAALQELNALPAASLTSSAEQSSSNGESRITVHLTNSSPTSALMVKMTLKDAATGERILPAYYSDNYVSLLGGETRTLTIDYPASSAKPSVALRGWNLKPDVIAVK